MIFGVPKQIKDNETRVGMTPSGVSQLTAAGNTVLVEKGAGKKGGFPGLRPSSPIAGKGAVFMAAQYLNSVNGGSGIMLADLPGIERAHITVIGAGHAGIGAAETAAALGNNVTHLDINLDALDEFLALDEPSVIITRWPCALKRFSDADKKEFSGAFTQRFTIDASKCIGCRLCMKCGCPAVSFDSKSKKAVIERIQCPGCEVCAQLCPKSAIVKEAE